MERGFGRGAGETEPDNLTGPGGPVTSGAHTYHGILPFIAVELPVADRINMRVGVGVGAAHQRLDVFSGGAKVISAEGASLLAQVGGGFRLKLAPCVDTGIDVFATYLDGVSGTGVGGTASGWMARGMWRPTHRSRFALSGAGQNGTCGCLVLDLRGRCGKHARSTQRNNNAWMPV